VRIDPELDSIVPSDARVEKLADGFTWTEGPVWVPAFENSDGYLLFSDVPRNTIYRHTPDGELFVFRPKSGYTGFDIGEYREPGSNGLALDREGRLAICEHGNRRVTRIEKNGLVTVLADRFEGKRLNSPNDLAYRSDGSLYFTDPPFGLPQTFDDPRKELPFSGLFRLSHDGQLTLLTRELSAPNGLAFSPDERTLYVSNADPQRAIWMAYPVRDDGTLGPGRVLFDASEWAKTKKGLPDGMKTDQHGNLFATGPGGIHIFSREGKHLGTIETGVPTGNCAWGDDGSTLYITADTALYRVRLSTSGNEF
jgi:gluconolactonase